MIDAKGTLLAQARQRYEAERAAPAAPIQRLRTNPSTEVETKMAGLTDQWFEKKNASAPADPKAMDRLRETFRSRDYNIATMKKKTGQEMTPGEKAALERAERDYNIARVGEPKREDVREYDGMPISPGLPPKDTEPLGLDWSIAIGRERDPFIQKSLAKQTISAILNREHPASRAYWDATHPDNATVVANVFSLREIANAK
jgi:hypothetical protein